MDRIKRCKFTDGMKVLVELRVIGLENWMDGSARQQDKKCRTRRSLPEVVAWKES